MIRVREAAPTRNLFIPGLRRQMQFKKPLCVFTPAPLARMATLKRAILMQVTVSSSSGVLCFHGLQMFKEVPLLPTSSGCVKAKGTVGNAET